MGQDEGGRLRLISVELRRRRGHQLKVQSWLERRTSGFQDSGMSYTQEDEGASEASLPGRLSVVAGPR